jgi:CRP-like cAMP-binding protein
MRSRPFWLRELRLSPDDHPLQCFASELDRLVPLSEEDREAVLDLPGRVRRLDAGSYLVREGSIPAHCAILVDGYAYRQKVTGEGSRQILAVCIPGDAVDLQNIFLDVADHSVQMMSVGHVVDVPREHIQQLMLSHPNLSRAIMQLTLVEAAILREWVVNVGRRHARERIAHILCEFAVRLDTRGLASGDSYELPMTQEQLADATALTPVHVNRVLKSLESDGLIKRKRRHIQFPDWRALQDAADFSRTYLHIPSEDHVGYPGAPPIAKLISVKDGLAPPS